MLKEIIRKEYSEYIFKIQYIIYKYIFIYIYTYFIKSYISGVFKPLKTQQNNKKCNKYKYEH